MFTWIRWAGTGVAALIIIGMVWATYSWAYNRGVAAQTVYTTQARQDAARAVDANQSNLTTITTLSARNAACVASVAARTATADAAVADLETERAKRAAAETASRRARAVIYSQDKSAASWGPAPVPASLAEALRQ